MPTRSTHGPKYGKTATNRVEGALRRLKRSSHKSGHGTRSKGAKLPRKPES